MRKAMLYIHGKGGSAEEAAQCRPFCAGYDVRGISLADFTPWGSTGQIRAVFNEMREECGRVSVLANSIGTSLAIKCRAKDIYGTNLFEMRLPETERR